LPTWIAGCGTLMYRVSTPTWGALAGIGARSSCPYAARTQEGKKAEAAADGRRQPGTHPTHPLDRYAGIYTDSLYGRAEVRLVDERLVLNYPGPGDADLEHWHYDTFTLNWRKPWLGHDRAVFKLDGDGQVTGIEFLDMHLAKAAAPAP
jgi:hypothetical protein